MQLTKYKNFIKNYTGDLYLAKPKVSGFHCKIIIEGGKSEVRGHKSNIVKEWFKDVKFNFKDKIEIHGILAGQGLGRKRCATENLPNPMFFIYAVVYDGHPFITTEIIEGIILYGIENYKKYFHIAPTEIVSVSLFKDLEELKRIVNYNSKHAPFLRGYKGLGDGLILFNQETGKMNDCFVVSYPDDLKAKAENPLAEEAARLLVTKEVVRRMWNNQEREKFYQDIQQYLYHKNVDKGLVHGIPWKDVSKYVNNISQEIVDSF